MEKIATNEVVIIVDANKCKLNTKNIQILICFIYYKKPFYKTLTLIVSHFLMDRCIHRIENILMTS